MNKPIAYNEVKYSIQPGVMFADSTLNEFFSEDGGIVRGNMIALAGTSGAGKTTLCKKLQKELPNDMISTFFALESKKGSVARQTERVTTNNNAQICDSNDYPTWTAFMEYLNTEVPTMVIVDSLQHAAELLSEENGKDKYSNYKKIVKDLYNWKDENNTIVIMIVQLNSKGEVEGPVATVFDVDAPMFLIANPKTGERTLHASKNRMGGLIGTPIYYEFVADDRVIQFYSQNEWEIMRTNKPVALMVQGTLKAYIDAFKNHDNFKAFKKEFNKEYNKIYKANSTDGVAIVTQLIVVIDSLSKEYFTQAA